MVFPSLVNATNESIEQQISLTIEPALAASPDVIYLASALVIIGFFLLFLYLAETRKDIGFAMFMGLVAGMAFNDPLLASIKYPLYGGYEPSLPFLMIIAGGYETLMTLMLLTELRRRKNAGEIETSEFK